MSKKSQFVNVMDVAIGGKAPTEAFPLEVDASGEPVELYWRKRKAEGAIKPAPKSPPSPKAEAPKADAKTPKKGS